MIVDAVGAGAGRRRAIGHLLGFSLTLAVLGLVALAVMAVFDDPRPATDADLSKQFDVVSVRVGAVDLPVPDAPDQWRVSVSAPSLQVSFGPGCSVHHDVSLLVSGELRLTRAPGPPCDDSDAARVVDEVLQRGAMATRAGAGEDIEIRNDGRAILLRPSEDQG